MPSAQTGAVLTTHFEERRGPAFLYALRDPEIVGVAYVPRSHCLYLRFRNEVTRMYRDVPGSVYRRLIDAQPHASVAAAPVLATCIEQDIMPLPVLNAGPPPLV